MKSSLEYTETFSLKKINDNIVQLDRIGGIPGKTLYFKLKSSPELLESINNSLIEYLKFYNADIIGAELSLVEGNIKLLIKNLGYSKAESISDKTEDIYYQIAFKTDEQTLNNLCLVDTNFNKLCANPNFWKNLIRMRFPTIFRNTDIAHDWKKIYLEILRYQDKFIKNLAIGEYLELHYSRGETAPSEFIQYLLENNFIPETYLIFILRYIISSGNLVSVKKILSETENFIKEKGITYDNNRDYMIYIWDRLKHAVDLAVTLKKDDMILELINFLVNTNYFNMDGDFYHISFSDTTIKYLLKAPYISSEIKDRL